MREAKTYRDNLERININFPNKELLTISDVSRYTGLSRTKVSNDLGSEFKKYGNSKYISKVKLAHLLS